MDIIMNHRQEKAKVKTEIEKDRLLEYQVPGLSGLVRKLARISHMPMALSILRRTTKVSI